MQAGLASSGGVSVAQPCTGLGFTQPSSGATMQVASQVVRAPFAFASGACYECSTSAKSAYRYCRARTGGTAALSRTHGWAVRRPTEADPRTKDLRQLSAGFYDAGRV